jgi:hypothetical protein
MYYQVLSYVERASRFIIARRQVVTLLENVDFLAQIQSHLKLTVATFHQINKLCLNREVISP